MASTAPLISSVFFANPGAVYGLAAAGALVAGGAEGGLTSLTPVGKGIVCYSGDATPVLTCSINPEVAGTLTARKLVATTGGIDCGGKLTVTSGGLAVSAGGIEVAGEYHLLLSQPPEEALHAATKGYVDSVASGLHIKPAVRLRTVAALPANSPSDDFRTLTGTLAGPLGGASFDGDISPEEGDRVLVANEGEAGAVNHGIYIVTALGSNGSPGTHWVLTRPPDADSSDRLPGGTFVFVTEGNTYGDRGFVLTADDVVLGTTPLVFTQFTSTSTSPGGSNAQVQFNNGGSFGGIEGFTFDRESGILSLAGGITVEAAPGAPNHLTNKAYVDGQDNDLVAQITALDGQVADLAATRATTVSLDAAVSALEEADSALDTRVTALDGQVSDLAATRATTVSLDAAVSALEEADSALDTRVTALDGQVADLATTRATTVSLDAAVSALEEADSALDTRVTALEGVGTPGGSSGQVQYHDGSGGFAGSESFTYDSVAGVTVANVPFAVSVGGDGLGGNGTLTVDSIGVAIAGIETTIAAGVGGVTGSPGIVVNASSAAIYGAGGSGGAFSLVANNIGVSITGAYQLSSGGGKPIQLKGDPDAGATDYVVVGAISAQASGQEGAAVAFGAGAGVTARRGIALGMGAVARVADAAVVPALSLSQRVGSASAALVRSGLAAYAAGMTFIPSAPLDLKTTASSSYTVPAGMMFIPLGAVIWLHARAFAESGAIAASPTLAATLANAGGRVILPATALAITRDSPVGLAVGATPSDLTAVAAGGVIFYRVAAATTDESITSATARVALYGLCVELES